MIGCEMRSHHPWSWAKVNYFNISLLTKILSFPQCCLGGMYMFQISWPSMCFDTGATHLINCPLLNWKCNYQAIIFPIIESQQVIITTARLYWAPYQDIVFLYICWAISVTVEHFIVFFNEKYKSECVVFVWMFLSLMLRSTLGYRMMNSCGFLFTAASFITAFKGPHWCLCMF